MPYNKQVWVDKFIDPDSGQVTNGTPISASRLNNIESGIEEAHIQLLSLDGVNIRISRIEAYLDIDSRGVSGAQARFADTYDGQLDTIIQMDETKAYSLAAIPISLSPVGIQVSSVLGFFAGKEITIASSAGVENKKISSIDGNVITLPSIDISHPKGTLIARSTVERDTVSQKLKVGYWATHTLTITQL